MTSSTATSTESSVSLISCPIHKTKTKFTSDKHSYAKRVVDIKKNSAKISTVYPSRMGITEKNNLPQTSSSDNSLQAIEFDGTDNESLKSKQKGNHSSSTLNKGILLRSLLTLYALMSLVSRWLLVIEIFILLLVDNEGNKSFLLYRLAFLAFLSYISFAGMFFYPPFFDRWLLDVIKHMDLYHSKAAKMDLDHTAIFAKAKRMNSWVVVSVVFLTAIGSISAYIFMFTPRRIKFSGSEMVLLPALRNITAAKLTCVVTMGNSLGVWALIQNFQISLIICLRNQFSQFNNHVVKLSVMDEASLVERLATYRLLYQHLWLSVAAIDKKVDVLMAMSMITCIIFNVLLLSINFVKQPTVSFGILLALWILSANLIFYLTYAACCCLYIQASVYLKPTYFQ